jgi:short-subunit dehydrogenase
MEATVNLKKALVTGASSGIGHEFARALAGENYCVTGVARNEEKLTHIFKELGDEHRFIVADLTQSKQLAKIEKELAEIKFDLLINNAGYAIYDYFENIALEQHENVMYVNMNAVVRLSYAFLRTAATGDALINVSSALSRLSYPGGAVYCGTKGFVTCFSESLWYEYKNKGVYVMALLPGVTLTDFHRVAFRGDPYKLPNRMAYPPEVVVSEAMKVLKERKRPSFLTGPRFRYLTSIVSRFLSRKKMIEIMGTNNPIFQDEARIK